MRIMSNFGYFSKVIFMMWFEIEFHISSTHPSLPVAVQELL